MIIERWGIFHPRYLVLQSANNRNASLCSVFVYSILLLLLDRKVEILEAMAPIICN